MFNVYGDQTVNRGLQDINFGDFRFFEAAFALSGAFQFPLSKTILYTEIPELGFLMHKHILMLPKICLSTRKRHYIRLTTLGILVHKMVLLRCDCFAKL